MRGCHNCGACLHAPRAFESVQGILDFLDHLQNIIYDEKYSFFPGIWRAAVYSSMKSVSMSRSI